MCLDCSRRHDAKAGGSGMGRRQSPLDKCRPRQAGSVIHCQCDVKTANVEEVAQLGTDSCCIAQQVDGTVQLSANNNSHVQHNC